MAFDSIRIIDRTGNAVNERQQLNNTILAIKDALSGLDTKIDRKLIGNQAEPIPPEDLPENIALVESGEWTPTLAGSSTAGSHTYTTQTGKWHKVDKLIYVDFELDISTVDAAMSGDISIKGMPYFVVNSAAGAAFSVFSPKGSLPAAEEAEELSGSIDLTSVSYTGNSFDHNLIGPTEDRIIGIFIPAPGDYYFATGLDTDSIIRYELSTAYDLSTAAYSGNIKSTSSEDTIPAAVCFDPTGTIMYVLGENTGFVYKYTLSSAYDLTTAGYDSVSFDLSGQIGSGITSFADSLTFSSDGLNFYVSENDLGKTFQYTMSTAWDLSTASYSGNSFTAASFSGILSAYIAESGLKFYYLDNSTDRVVEYELSTQWDISTATETGTTFATTTQDTNPYAIAFNETAQKMYVFGDTSESSYEYDVTVVSYGFDYDDVSFSVSSQATGPTAVAFNSSGTRMFIHDVPSEFVYQYDLGTAWDITSAVYNSENLDVSQPSGASWKVSFSDDGSIMYIVTSSTSLVIQYALSTAWDVTTGTANGSFALSSQDGNPEQVRFNSTGSKMFMVGTTNDRVYQYSLSTNWDVTTASYDSVFLSVASEATFPTDIFFANSGAELYVIGVTSDSVHKYTLSTAYDLSTGSYSGESFDLSRQDTDPWGFFIDEGNNKAYMVGASNDTVFQYTFTTPPPAAAPATPLQFLGELRLGQIDMEYVADNLNHYSVNENFLADGAYFKGSAVYTTVE